MAARLFAVVVDNDEKRSRVLENLRRGPYTTYDHDGAIILVSAPGAMSQDISTAAGLGAEMTGVVFRLNGAYSGYTAKSLWERLGDQEDA